MTFHILQFFFLLVCCFCLANSLECITCDGALNSPCQTGTAQSSSSCPPDQQSCFEEYIQNRGKPELFRKGCGLPDRCNTSAQANVHGNDLKFCRTCQGDKCNNKVIRLSYFRQCVVCEGSANSPCQMGTAESSSRFCPLDRISCIEEHHQYSGQPPLYRRACSIPYTCQTFGSRKLKFCRDCYEDNCNNKPMELAKALDCIKCEGSVETRCQMGKATSSTRCPPDLPSCYEEYIQYDQQRPLYRRDCGLPDRCTKSARTLRDNLKSCRTCQDNNCNNKAITLVIENECLKCVGYSGSGCRTGEVNTVEICSPQEKECYEMMIGSTDKSTYVRGCASPDTYLTEVRRYYVLAYRSCKGRKCNNKRIESTQRII